jgi:hypothetical protein
MEKGEYESEEKDVFHGSTFAQKEVKVVTCA